MRRSVAALALLTACFPLPAAAFQSMHAQRAIQLVINASPAVVYLDLPGHGLGAGIGRFVAFTAPVTVAATQASTNVNANVIADPNAGLLVLNKTVYSVTQTAGTTVTYSCAFTVQMGVSSTTSWTLDDGLASDFSTALAASAVSFTAYPTPGSAPSSPIWTNYVNYYTNNNNWQVTAHATGPVTECVDLKVTLPASLPGGQYSATAVYSLFY